MRLTFKILPALVMSMLVAASLSAQDQQNSQDRIKQSSAANETDSAQQHSRQAMATMASNKIVGVYVYGPSDESVGDINSLILRKNGSVMAAVVGLGVVAGVGETNILVPWKAVNCKMMQDGDKKTCKFTVPMTAQQLKSAPKLEAKNHAEIYDEAWVKTNAEFYGQKPGETPEANSCISVDQLTGTELSDQGEDSESLGSIHALMINVRNGKTPYVILARGGTLGLGEKYVALPFEKIDVTCDAEGKCTAVASTTAKQLKESPKVTPGDYPELELPSFRKRIAQQFDVKQNVKR